MPSFLKEPSLRGISPGSTKFFARQREIINERPLLKRAYDDWYARLLADVETAPGPGQVLELGSGGSYLKTLAPSIITSDVVPGVADQVIDARHLPFGDGQLKAILLTHVFHHIPEVDKFLSEAERTLQPGGVIGMIEVAHTPFARFFFRNFHHEPYEDRQQSWNFAQQDSMMDSNQALSWMVFHRDQKDFMTRHPKLVIEVMELMPWFTYFVSGGVTMRDIVPRFLNWSLIALEKMMKPANPLLSLYWHIRVRRL
jgi:SAM-dependent methyltransferase